MLHLIYEDPEQQLNLLTDALVRRTHCCTMNYLPFLTSDLLSLSFIWEEIPDLLKFNISDKWRERWNDVSPCNYHLCIDPTLKPGGFDLPRKSWKRLNRIRTGYGCCNSCLFKWNLTNSPACDCGATEQTMSHIITSCPLRRFADSLGELSEAKSSRAVHYLMRLDINL